MLESTYDVIEIVGTSSISWEDAINHAIEVASRSIRDIRVAEVVKQDVTMDDGVVTGYRVRLTLSFKYHPRSEMLPWET